MPRPVILPDVFELLELGEELSFFPISPPALFLIPKPVMEPGVFDDMVARVGGSYMQRDCSLSILQEIMR